MVRGADKSGARRRVRISTPGGTKERYLEKKPGIARCVSGRPLPGVASGRKASVRKLSKTQRRPSRPYGGVLSSPVMRSLLRQQAMLDADEAISTSPNVFVVGRVCMKIAGRDAGKYCVVLTEPSDNRVLIDGQTRRRSVNTAHLEPTGQVLDVKPNADSKTVYKLLSSINIIVPELVPQKQKASKQVKEA